MKTIEPSIEIINMQEPEQIYKTLEIAARNCYKSEHKIHNDSAEKFLKSLIKAGHHSILEHVKITIRLVTDRGVMAEITRHRHAGFSIESTRYCNYSKDKILSFVKPCEIKNATDENLIWQQAMRHAEHQYLDLIDIGVKPENARSVLPMSLKTDIIMSANIRSWRDILELRLTKAAHPDMRLLMRLVLIELNKKLPVLFGDIAEKYLKEDNESI